MGRFHIGIKGQDEIAQKLPIVSGYDPLPMIMESKDLPSISIQPEIVYVDRQVEIVNEIEKIVYIDRIVESEPRVIIEYKTVEVPVMYEKIVEVPVEVIKEVVIEKQNRVIDITNHLEVKKELRKNKQYKKALALSLIINVILLCLAVK